MNALLTHIVDGIFVGADEAGSNKLAENSLAVLVCLLVGGGHAVCNKKLAQ